MQVPVLARLVANCYTLLYFALLYHGSARRNSWVTSTQRHDNHAFQMATARTPVSGCNHLTIFVQANLHPVRNHTSNKVAHHTTLLYSPLSQIKIITLVFVTLSIILSVTSHQQKLPFWTWHWIHAVKHNITFQLKLQKLQELRLFNALTFLMKGHLACLKTPSSGTLHGDQRQMEQSKTWKMNLRYLVADQQHYLLVTQLKYHIDV